MIAGYVIAASLYLFALACLAAMPAEWIAATNDFLVRTFVKASEPKFTRAVDGQTVRVDVEIRYRFGGSIVLGAWLGTLHAVAFLRGL